MDVEGCYLMFKRPSGTGVGGGEGGGRRRGTTLTTTVCCSGGDTGVGS